MMMLRYITNSRVFMRLFGDLRCANTHALDARSEQDPGWSAWSSAMFRRSCKITMCAISSASKVFCVSQKRCQSPWLSFSICVSLLPRLAAFHA